MEMHDYSKVDSSEILYEEPAGGFKTTPDDGNNAGEQSSSACAKTSEYERVGSNDVERREPTHIYTNYTNDAEQSVSPAEVKRSSFKCSKLLCLTITVVLLLIAFASAASYVTYLTLRLSALEEIVTERLIEPSPDQYQDVRAEIQNLEDRLSSQINATHHHSTTPAPEVQTYEDCQAAWERGVRVAGIYRLSTGQLQTFSARCQFDSSHGWTVIQRRYDGSVDFYLPWDSYKRGFGSLHGEYWLGNEKIFSLTRRNRKLSIYLMRWDGDEATANYSNFYISNESDNYRLTVVMYISTSHPATSAPFVLTVCDCMARHNGSSFSTHDRDNDAWGGQCAHRDRGAWWYYQCASSNLNGLYTNSSTSDDYTNMWWGGSWSGSYSRPLRMTNIMISRD